MKRILILMSSLIVVSGIAAQEEDTLYVPPVQEALPLDSTMADSLIMTDSLTGAQKSILEFQQKREDFQESRKERKPSIVFFDSVLTYFTTPRLDLRDEVDRSFYHDAGDYFRFNPSYTVRDYSATPMRKTVQPFGLTGNRLNVVANRLALSPFEHVVQPDGMIDFNDIPMELDHHIYILPGPAGQLFGGDQAIATMVTLPEEPDTYTPESAFMVDQGSFDYNYVRGKYSKKFISGRDLDLSIGYRNTSGLIPAGRDDQYQYTGRLFQPLGIDYGIRFSGQLYSRGGLFRVKPEEAGAVLERNRIDRKAQIALEKHNPEHTVRTEIGYSYLKQGSNIDGTYKGRFDINGDGLFLVREWSSGNSIFTAEIEGDRKIFKDGFDEFDRNGGKATIRVARLNPGLRWAMIGGVEKVQGFSAMPSASLMLFSDNEKSFFLLSAGYHERAPSLHELNLRYQRASLSSSEADDYADTGNKDLVKERQVVGSAMMELGGVSTSARLTVTAGRVFNGIDWITTELRDSVFVSYTLFSPANINFDFLDVCLQQRLRLGDALRLTAGGAYHRIEYERFEQRPYQPEYEAFAGAELHQFWPQRNIHLYAYAEVVYTGEYIGYEEPDLGNAAVINTKLSFRIKDFRFHWVQQNALSKVYSPRDYFVNPGRYSYFGITWHFLN
ncbi:MAG: hypothetical protein AB1483_03440 [Candidatus Zixiibacteriota bacterium]